MNSTKLQCWMVFSLTNNPSLCPLSVSAKPIRAWNVDDASCLCLKKEKKNNEQQYHNVAVSLFFPVAEILRETPAVAILPSHRARFSLHRVTLRVSAFTSAHGTKPKWQLQRRGGATHSKEEAGSREDALTCVPLIGQPHTNVRK